MKRKQFNILLRNERFLNALRIVLLILTGLLLLAFILRTPMASWYLQRRVGQFNKANNVTLKITGVRVHGVASVLVTGISLKPATGDTLVTIDSAFASVGILKLFAGRLALHDVRLINISILAVSTDSTANYRFLLHGRRETADTVKRPVNFATASDRMMRFIFDKIPLSLTIRNLRVAMIYNGHRLDLRLEKFDLASHYFRSSLFVEENDTVSQWTLAGRIDNASRMAEFRVFSGEKSRITVPFIRHQWSAGVKFDTLAFSLAGQEGSEGVTALRGFVSVSGLEVDHFRIARQPVTFDRMEIRYQVNAGTDFVELDSSSAVTFNRIDFHPYLRYRPLPSKQITLRIHKPPFAAQDLFSSFPAGLFSNLDGLRVKGNLSWNLDFFVDLAIPDSLEFATSLDRHQFSVLSYGQADLTKLNSPFSYTAYDHDLPVRTFMVGPENPEYRPLNRISEYLQKAVLTSEDGGFYQHRGFLADAFRESVITNIKERRFARGGSTISMQLVKNVFLSRNKTIARKLEEALIVWLIENLGLSTKDRMYEVYLNLIEWGPLVYGANEASNFYFRKDASRLTLAEAIFMASVIPRPKWFRYSFDENGHLRESMAGYYSLVSEKMLRKGWITADDAAKLIPGVELRGPARLLLKQAGQPAGDTLPGFLPD